MGRLISITRYVVVALAMLASACSDGVQPLDIAEPAFARPGGGGGGGGGKVLYDAAVTGDLALLDAVQAERKSSDPFGNPDLTFENVRVNVSGPTGDLTNCRVSYPNLTFATDWAGHEGDWTGQLMVKGGTHTVNFLGTRLVDGTTEQFQSTIQANAEPRQDPSTGVWYLELDDAAQFSDTRTTGYDGFYRCVDVTVVLSPA